MERRKFIKKASLSALTAFLGTEIVFGNRIPVDYTLLALHNPDPFKMFNKDKQMVVLNDTPWNIEAKAHLLDEKITSNKYMFVRNNGKIPQDIDPENWTLTIDGEAAEQTKVYTLRELQTKFKPCTYQLTLECGGNGRSEFNPPAKGN